MKILIYGSKGWIGQQFITELTKQNIDFIEGSSRAINQEQLINEINSIKPTHIVSLIGRTHGVHNGVEYTTIDYLEQSGRLVENVREEESKFSLNKLLN